MEKTLVNRVANSGLITINLENFYPQNTIKELDIKQFLFHELLLKEKDFRAAMKEWEWSQYEGAHLCVFCSNDAIIPTWAYMLIATYTQNVSATIFLGTQVDFLNHHYTNTIASLEVEAYENERIIIKGCSNKPVPPGAYMMLTHKLKPVARSIMFGEPCSTVPIYKKPRVKKS